MKGNLFLFLLVPFLLSAVACDRISENPQEDEMARLEAWLQVHNITTTPTSSGLYYINQQEGTGSSLVDSNFYFITYTIKNLDGDVLETTNKYIAKQNDIFNSIMHYVPVYSPYLTSSGFIKGGIEGLGMMKEGGKARLIIPSKLAYQSSGHTFNTGIINPAYSTLIYDIELNKIVPDPKAYEQSLIDQYLSTHPGFTLVNDSIYVKRISPGTRSCVVAKDSVVLINYVGRFLDGFIFDTNVKSVAIDSNIYVASNSSTKYETMEVIIGANKVVSGYDLAIRQMIEGEKIVVLIPSRYAYGADGFNGNNSSTTTAPNTTAINTTPIPPYAPLIFEIELKNVNPEGTSTKSK